MSRCAKGHRHPNHKPYGGKRGVYWCYGCDAALVPNEPSKKAERAMAKRKLSRIERDLPKLMDQLKRKPLKNPENI